jgi:hypothetical protein
LSGQADSFVSQAMTPVPSDNSIQGTSDNRSEGALGSRTKRLRRLVLLHVLRRVLETVCMENLTKNCAVKRRRKLLFNSILERIERADF